MIWHIYSGQHCFKGVAGMDLASSGDVAPTMAQVPSEFRANRPTFVFQGKMSRGSAGPRGLGVWTCRLQGVMPYLWPRSPVSFEWIGQPLVFRGKLRQGGEKPTSPADDGGSSAAGGSGRDLAHLLGAVLLQGGCGYGPAVFRGCLPPPLPRSPVSFERIGQPSFFRGK